MHFENMAYAGGSGQQLRDQAIALSGTQSVNTTVSLGSQKYITTGDKFVGFFLFTPDDPFVINVCQLTSFPHEGP